MKLDRLGRTLLGMTLTAGLSLAVLAPVSAQEATPVATPAADCVATDASDAAVWIEEYFTTLADGDDAAHLALLEDTERIDAIFSEDIVIDREYDNQPGDEDEIAIITGGDFHLVSGFAINEFIVTEDLIIVYYTTELTADQVPGATPGSSAVVDSVGIYTVACGEVTGFETLSDNLEALGDLGFTIVPATEATPAT